MTLLNHGYNLLAYGKLAIHVYQIDRVVTFAQELHVLARQQIYGARRYPRCREHLAVFRYVTRLRGTYYDDGVADDQALCQFLKQIHFFHLHKRDNAFRLIGFC